MSLDAIVSIPVIMGVRFGISLFDLIRHYWLILDSILENTRRNIFKHFFSTFQKSKFLPFTSSDWMMIIAENFDFRKQRNFSHIAICTWKFFCLRSWASKLLRNLKKKSIAIYSFFVVFLSSPDIGDFITHPQSIDLVSNGIAVLSCRTGRTFPQAEVWWERNSIRIPNQPEMGVQNSSLIRFANDTGTEVHMRLEMTGKTLKAGTYRCVAQNSALPPVYSREAYVNVTRKWKNKKKQLEITPVAKKKPK